MVLGFFLSNPCLSMDDASLSRMWIFGLCLLLVNVDRIDIVVSLISAVLRVFMVIARMLLVS